MKKKYEKEINERVGIVTCEAASKRYNKWIKLLSLVMVSILLLLSAGCNSKNEDATADSNCENVNTAVADCIINGREFYFVSDEVKKEWKESLAKLLSNVLIPYGEHGDILGYEATVDPKAPVIPQCYECGLLDITMDGVPELLVHPFGYFGSSGTATYFVYNIYSGQKLGEIDGGNGQSWCFYYNTEFESVDLIGQYWLRGGWDWRDRYITGVWYDEANMKCFETQHFRTTHEITGEQTDIVDEDPDDMFYTATWVESYPNTTYYVGHQEAYLDDYYAEYNEFIMTHIRIPETELILFSWDDVSTDEDDYASKGKKMAEALISSDQEFIKPLG